MSSAPFYEPSPFSLERDAAEVNRGTTDMTAAPYLVNSYVQSSIAQDLTVALIGPDEKLRKAAGFAISGCMSNPLRQFATYPDNLDDLPRMLDQRHDAVIIELDSDPEYALALVEKISMHGRSTVMVYSNQTDPALLMRCMRAGAREFLTVPFQGPAVMEALERASQRRPAPLPRRAKAGKLLVFMGAKGGVGVTSVACNFAVALAQNRDQKTILIDLDLPLGDAALNLGIVAEFSTVDALQSAERLDGAILNQLLVEHSSGVSVLAAPGKFPHLEPTNEAVDKLIEVARQEFDNVVVDVGSRLNIENTALYHEATTVYLVTQAGIPELRNSNRLINQVFANGGPELEVVLNRFESRTIGVSEENITKALTRPAQWKVPNDHALVRKMQISGSPLALGDSSVARTIRQMADSVKGESDPQERAQNKKKGFSLFG